MNLTDILLFGKTILGDGGSSDVVKPIFDADLTYLESFDQMYYSDAGEGQLVEGTFYMVTLGDSVYAAKAKRLVDEETPDWVALYLGNAAIDDVGVDSGEPFFYLEQNTPDGGSERSFSATNGASRVTITKTESSGGSSDGGTKAYFYNSGMSGLEVYDLYGQAFLKLSNDIPEKSDVEGGVLGLYGDGVNICVPAVDYVEEIVEGALGVGEAFLILTGSGALSLGFPSSGVWVSTYLSMCVLAYNA